MPNIIKFTNGLSASHWYQDNCHVFYRVFISGWDDPIICFGVGQTIEPVQDYESMQFVRRAR